MRCTACRCRPARRDGLCFVCLDHTPKRECPNCGRPSASPSSNLCAAGLTGRPCVIEDEPIYDGTESVPGTEPGDFKPNEVRIVHASGLREHDEDGVSYRPKLLRSDGKRLVWSGHTLPNKGAAKLFGQRYVGKSIDFVPFDWHVEQD